MSLESAAQQELSNSGDDMHKIMQVEIAIQGLNQIRISVTQMAGRLARW